jgi:phage portal protein BeeE
MIDQSNNHNLTLLEKGFNPAGIVSVNTDDTESFEQFRKDFKNKYQGSGNAGSPVVTKGEDVKFQGFGQTNRDMEYSKTKKMAQDTTYQRFEIPKPLVDGSAQTFNNYQTARGALYDDAVFPLANKIFEGLTKIFFDRNLLGDNEFITYDIGSIPALQLRRNEELKSLQSSYALSLNELRTVAGYEEVTGGDVILAPATLVPVATDEFTEDNLDEPSKEFVATMIKNGADSSEIKGLWFEYKAAFRPNQESAS